MISSLLSSTQRRSARMFATISAAVSRDKSADVKFSLSGHATTILLDRPAALNAINSNIINSISAALPEILNDPRTNVIVIRGSGGKAFCAGGDIKALHGAGQQISGKPSPQMRFFKSEYLADLSLALASKPVVSLIDGITMGGGVGVSIHGAFRVATERTVIAMPETAIGFFPDVGASHPLSRLRNYYGTYLALTGRRVTGEEAINLGIATHFVHSSRIPALHHRLSELLIPSAAAVDSLLNDFSSIPSPTREFLKEQDAVADVFGSSSIEDLRQRLSRHPHQSWVSSTTKMLDKASPTSLAVTFEQMRRACRLSLRSCFEMDYSLARRFMEMPDFFEGIRSLLIDKDNKPKWQTPPSTSEVAAYFSTVHAKNGDADLF